MRSTKRPFAPIADCEAAIFADLHLKEAATAPKEGHKPCLPRFSLIRGEVALLAERIRLITRQGA